MNADAARSAAGRSVLGPASVDGHTIKAFTVVARAKIAKTPSDFMLLAGCVDTLDGGGSRAHTLDVDTYACIGHRYCSNLYIVFIILSMEV